MAKTIQEEVDANFDVFRQILPSIIRDNRDKYALMKDGKILGFYSSPLDARVAAETFIADKVYSIQHVTDQSINLGYFTYAVPGNSVQP